VSGKVSIARTLQQALSLLGDIRFGEAPSIAIKPNLCAAVDREGGTTVSPNTVDAIIRWILNTDGEAQILIVESDSVGKSVEKAFDNLGYRQLERRHRSLGHHVSLVNLSREPTSAIELKGLHLKALRLPQVVLKPNYFISVAKAKTHSITQITGSLKNQFGCLPEKQKSIHHRHIDEVIVDVNSIIKPDLCIIDGLMALDGERARRLGIFLCGKNPASVDAVLARTMGFDPARVNHLLLAQRQSLGTLNPEVLGERVESVAMSFHRPNTLVPRIASYVPDPLIPILRTLYRGVSRLTKEARPPNRDEGRVHEPR